MRMRKLLVATLFAGGALFLMPGMAAAQEQPTGSTTHVSLPEANEECIKLLEQPNKKIDDCQKAPSPILPATNELIWGSISFVILLGMLYKFAWPGLKAGLEARTERIRSDLDAAESAKSDADNILNEYKAQLADARNESARIIEEARQAADSLRRDQEQRLQNELSQLRERAAADIESAKRQAIADLRDEVAQLAIGAAEVIVQRNLDRDTQVRLVESYIEQVLSRSN
ncbi:MAG: F-type H+-transporting ATPase subunit b [Acidimicrobiaceae bacterium]|jgi:F-type H+-transporting ATPase subunit b